MSSTRYIGAACYLATADRCAEPDWCVLPDGRQPTVPLWLKASRLKLAAKAVELGGSRLLLKEKKFSRVVTRS